MSRKAAVIGGGLIALALVMAFNAVPHALAVSPGTQGQPNESCQSVFPSGPLTPNGFNTAGFARAGTVYAGSGANTNTSANSAAVSQYDVACFQVAQH